ncbi:MAG: MFS transporter [Gammaproteobacteria bacterium]|nr:MFS transporter [Gammaproteobacteria bacterium]
MEAVPFGRWHRKPRIVVGTATFFDAFDALSLAFALPVLVMLWDIAPAQIGVLISASYVGQLIGALAFSSLAEKHGRIRGATAAVTIMSIMSFACIFAGDFQMLLLLRFLQGIGIGGHMPVAAAYISELSRARGRGRFFLLYEMIFPVGLMVTGQIGRLVVPGLGWQAMFLIGAIPGLIVAYLISKLPESPRWLINRGRLDEAERIIEAMESCNAYAMKTDTEAAPPAPSPEPKAIAQAPGPRKTRWLELLSPAYLSRTLTVWALWASAYFIANGLNNWMPTLYTTVYELELGTALFAASLNNVAQVLLLLVCVFTIDRIGRRNWVATSFVLGGAALAVFGMTGAQNPFALMVLGTLAYGIIGSTNAVLYLYTPEIYPTRMRAIGTGLATSWLRLASAAAPTIVGLMVGEQGVAAVFLMFAGVAVIGMIAATRMIETSNRRLEEIAQ